MTGKRSPEDREGRPRHASCEHAASRAAESLNAVNEILRSAESRDELLARLVGEVSEVAGADKCLVVEIDGETFSITHVRNVRDDLLVGEPKDASFYPMFAEAAERCAVIFAEDNWNDPRTNKEFVVPHGLRAFQLLPLVVDGETRAVLAFGYDAPRTFEESDTYLAERMATAMSLALRGVMTLDRLREARRELEEVVADLNRAQSVASVGSWRLDTRRDVLTWSEEAYRMFGVPPGTPMTYGSFLDVVHPHDRRRVDDAWTAALGGRPYDIEHRILVDGRVIWVREQAALEFDEHGALLGGFGTVQDVTERKLVELERRRESLEIGAANQLLGVFVQKSGDDLFRHALEVFLAMTGSRYGVIGYVDDSGDLISPTMSDVFEECRMDERSIVFYRHKWTGLWGRALAEQRVLFSNDPIRVPDGHVPMTRNLAVPILFEGESIGLVNLANKDTDYTEDDVAFIRGVTDRIAPVFYAWIQREMLRREREDAEQERKAAHARLRTLMDEVPVGMALLGPDAEVWEMNEATSRIWAGDLPKAGSVEAYSVYRGFHRDSGEPIRPEEWPATRAAATGEPVTDVVDVVRLDGTPATLRIAATPVKSRDGAVERIVVLTEDVTESVEREELDRHLNRVRELVSATLDVDEILLRAAEAGSDALKADSYALLWRDGETWTVTRASESIADAIGMVLTEDDQPGMSAGVGERKPIVATADDDAAEAYEGLMRAFGISSVTAVPLIMRGEAVGLLAFLSRKEPPGAGEARVAFASNLIAVLSLALDNASTYQRERLIAETLQQAIMTRPESIAGIEMAYLYQPASDSARVGGDFYDLFPIGPRHAGIVVGDVSGKGIDAARLTTLVRDGIRAYAYEHAAPSGILQHVNDLVWRSSAVEVFATVFLAILDLVTGELKYCAAGHPPGFVITADGIERLSDPRSGIVGAFGHATFCEDSRPLRPGDTLVVFTDGITEARCDDDLFSEEGVAETLEHLCDEPLEELPCGIVEAATGFAGGDLSDDTVVVCVRFVGMAEDAGYDADGAGAVAS